IQATPSNHSSQQEATLITKPARGHTHHQASKRPHSSPSQQEATLITKPPLKPASCPGMKVIVLVVGVVVWLVLGSTGSHPSNYPNSELELEPRRRLCGWRLANKLNSVCKGVYNKPQYADNLLYYRGRRVGGKTGLQQQPEALKELFSDDVIVMASRGHSTSTPPVLPIVSTDTAEQDNRELEDLLNMQLSQDPSQSASRENEDSKTHLPFLTKMEALQMVRNRPRPKRGLSAECCQK
ncbi:hypothetical protein OTU49_004362, partial [Cherax quadricarinatus]